MDQMLLNSRRCVMDWCLPAFTDMGGPEEKHVDTGGGRITGYSPELNRALATV